MAKEGYVKLDCLTAEKNFSTGAEICPLRRATTPTTTDSGAGTSGKTFTREPARPSKSSLHQRNAASGFHGRDNTRRAVMLLGSAWPPFERLENGSEPFAVFGVLFTRIADKPLLAKLTQIDRPGAGEPMRPVQGHTDVLAAKLREDKSLRPLSDGRMRSATCSVFWRSGHSFHSWRGHPGRPAFRAFRLEESERPRKQSGRE